MSSLAHPEKVVWLLGLGVIWIAFAFWCWRGRKASLPFFSFKLIRDRLKWPVLLSMVWVLSTFALMEPRGSGHYVKDIKPPHIPKSPVWLLLDVSGSMAVVDPGATITRYLKMRQIVSRLLDQPSDRPVSLWIFSSDTLPIVPFTDDFFFIQFMLQSLPATTQGGTHYDNLFKHMQEDLDQVKDKLGRIAFLFSDGANNSKEPVDDILKKMAVHGLILNTVGIGTQEGGVVPNVSQFYVSKLNESALKHVSEVTHGKYIDGSQPVEVVVNQILRTIQEQSHAIESKLVEKILQNQVVYDPYYLVPLWMALIIMFVLFLLIFKIRSLS